MVKQNMFARMNENGSFRTKRNPIRDCYRSNQLPSTDKKNQILAPYGSSHISELPFIIITLDFVVLRAGRYKGMEKYFFQIIFGHTFKFNLKGPQKEGGGRLEGGRLEGGGRVSREYLYLYIYTHILPLNSLPKFSLRVLCLKKP